MMSEQMITAQSALAAVHNNEHRPALIDVRSEKEFAKGAIPKFVNLPILDDEQRHQVGLAYKLRGQEAAMELGFRIVDRVGRARQWVDHARGKAVYLTCWRGGLRSKIAADWMTQAGLTAIRVDGGYKAMRHQLLQVLDCLPELVILSGLTGSGKTELLNALPHRSVDLEAHANHRGSTFGGMPEPQPSQTYFENRVLLDLNRSRQLFILEDESARIGRCSLPKPLVTRMRHAPVIWLESPIEERAARIYREYVEKPMRRHTKAQVRQSLLSSLDAIHRRLGGARFQQIQAKLNTAFQAPQPDQRDHAGWITDLLRDYYDPKYIYGFEKHQRLTIFSGSYQACKTWIQNRFD